MTNSLEPENAPIPEQDTFTNVGAKAARGAAFLVGAKLMGRFLDFVSLVVLTHLLLPADFGVVSLAMSVIYLTEAIFELPLSQALVVLETIDRDHLDTAFTLSFLRGSIICVLVFAISLPFSILYHDSRLFPLLMALSLAPALRGMQSPGLALYAKRLDFSRECIIDFLGKFGALIVAVCVAVTTRSYWAVAAATITSTAFGMIVSYVISPYKPHFTLSRWSDFRNFLGWSSGAQIVSAINWQYDRLILGRLVPPQTLGAFSIASDLVGIPSQAIIAPLSRPLLSALVARRDNLDHFRNLYQLSNATVFMIILPIFIEMSALSTEIVHTILGPKWEKSITYISLLAIPPILAGLAEGISALVMAFKKNHLYMRLNSLEFAFKIPIVTGAAYFFGALGACWGRICIAFLMMLVYLSTTKSLIKVSYGQVFFQNWRTCLSGFLSWLSIESIKWYLLPPSWPGIVKLFILGSAGLMAYVLALLALWSLTGKKPGSVEARVVGICMSKLRRSRVAL
ncbi:lipopolysaccharide biosynthesis protein [Gluconobacter albidus]|uniref:Lipopolysaccharide biosynthesis protein n=1 Tax=Gluconobacter albidus TaxID=318683 RepID=A0ABQ5X4U7_9PROT|nr:lipopolysaccharide biosynthesis protein [Gluconobacter albidus]MBS1026887.1 lipopolysaccharide biosynthesis protein [Gluconobacter albidus]GBQ84263.1 polysaccharide biosynthesis protein [Gluconobacter albidus NBRC 3250]GLQ70322.1 lipopolysaccharide biosynthesis protein [Gluconobacter albidus]